MNITWKDLDEYWIVESFNKKTNKWGAFPCSPTLTFDECLIKAVFVKEKNPESQLRMVKMKRLEIKEFEEAAE